jgi:hypothetical protein
MDLNNLHAGKALIKKIVEERLKKKPRQTTPKPVKDNEDPKTPQ